MCRKLKMFVWSSDYHTDHTSGLGVAVALDVEQARRMLAEQYVDSTGGGAGSSPEQRAADREAWIQRELHKSLAADPDQILDLPACVQVGGGG